jgi:AcrR family transcriptional regulator
MSRWEPDARSRLASASLELFVERGYENTTVAEIAERAGLTKRTFFRHFADKREVLFGGQETLSRLFIDAIVGAPGTAAPLDAVGAALSAVAPMFGPDRLSHVLGRQKIIAAHPDLQERELLKSSALTAAMIDGFRTRGMTELAAHVAAELGQIAFRTTFARWIDPANKLDFAEVAKQTLDELRTATESATAGH